MSERKTYRLDDGTFVRTQAEAKDSGQGFHIVMIAIDSKGLIDALNEVHNHGMTQQALLETHAEIETRQPQPTTTPEETVGKPQPEASSPVPPAAPHSWSLTDVEEFIQNSGPVELASITENACFRMKELAKGLK